MAIGLVFFKMCFARICSSFFWHWGNTEETFGAFWTTSAVLNLNPMSKKTVTHDSAKDACRHSHNGVQTKPQWLKNIAKLVHAKSIAALFALTCKKIFQYLIYSLKPMCVTNFGQLPRMIYIWGHPEYFEVVKTKVSFAEKS